MANTNRRVQAAFSLISIGCGGLANCMGIWSRTKFHWTLTSLITFLATCTCTIFMAYETEWHTQAKAGLPAAQTANDSALIALYTSDIRQNWVIIFGWAGCCAYLASTITCLVANQEDYRNSADITLD